MTNETGIEVLKSVVEPTLRASKLELESKGYQCKVIDLQSDRFGLLIYRTDDLSVAVNYYWVDGEKHFEQDVQLSGYRSDKETEFHTLTPEIVKRGVALGVDMLRKATAETTPHSTKS